VTIEPAEAPPNGRPGRFVCMSVTDTGIGIDEVTMLHIFEPFFTTKEKGKGTGLGLATVYGIVKQHGGWIDVHSVVGNGTSFRVYYPAVPAPDGEDAGEPPPRARPRPTEVVVLVCEDEAPVRASLARALRTMGCRVLEASSADEALRTWEAHRDEVRVIVTDMVLPGAMTGADLAERVHRARPDVPVILCSGYETGAVRDARGDVVYLPKPFALDALADAVRRSIGESPIV
jgi:two-component system, cell cycle sensor histidine kinase and response regulator CckA